MRWVMKAPSAGYNLGMTPRRLQYARSAEVLDQIVVALHAVSSLLVIPLAARDA